MQHIYKKINEPDICTNTNNNGDTLENLNSKLQIHSVIGSNIQSSNITSPMQNLAKNQKIEFQYKSHKKH